MSYESELLALKTEDGRIPPEDVVDWASKNPDSDLYNHPEFCGWDEKKLARRQLLEAARRIIRAEVSYETGAREFVSLTIDRSRPGGGYREMSDVLQVRALYEIMLTDALNELERVQKKYAMLKELEPAWDIIDKLRKKRRSSTSKTEQPRRQA